MRTVPEVSLGTLPTPVDSGCAGPPPPAQAPMSSAITASRMSTNGRRRLSVVVVIAALFLSSGDLQLVVTSSPPCTPGDRVRNRFGDVTELAPAGLDVVVNLLALRFRHKGRTKVHESVGGII